MLAVRVENANLLNLYEQIPPHEVEDGNENVNAVMKEFISLRTGDTAKGYKMAIIMMPFLTKIDCWYQKYRKEDTGNKKYLKCKRFW